MRKKLQLIVSVLFLGLTFQSANAQSELWGLTGGASTVFRVDQDGTNYSSTFFGGDPSQGFAPQGSLVKAPNGKLYGIATGGDVGADMTYQGVIFEFDPATLTYSKKWSFNKETGANSNGNLTVGPNGKLYGMTMQGGANEVGVIFEFDPNTYEYAKKFDFDIINGSSPLTNSLTLARNGRFYGMTNSGGSFGYGVIFEFDPNGNGYTKLFDFDGASVGGFPYGDLVQAINGKLYGMAILGGDHNEGVLFEFDPLTSLYTKKIDFQLSVNGAYPLNSLIQATNKKLYGRTGLGGAANNGVLFEFDYTTDSLVVKAEFEASTTGNEARGAMVESPNGKLYGMNSNGGAFNAGVLYEYDTLTGLLTKKHDFDFGTGGEPRGSLIVVTKSTVKMDQVITFNPLGTQTFSNIPLVLNASSSSGLPIKYTSSDSTIATIKGDTLVMIKAGIVSITAYQFGDGSYNAASPVIQILTIKKAKQVIKFNPLPVKVVGDPPFTLTATSSSGLPITYKSSDPKVASVNGNVVTILKHGTTTITAAQAGSSAYLPAGKVSRILQVNKKKVHNNCDDDDDADDKAKNRISVYPNPSSDFITIQIGNNSGRAQIAIYQLNGFQKLITETSQDEVKIDVSTYQNGIYILKITTGNTIQNIRFEKR